MPADREVVVVVRHAAAIVLGGLLLVACAAGRTAGSPSTAPASSAPAGNGGLRYVALGDSYTIGTAVAPGDRWPDQLVQELNPPPALELVANLAVNGATARDVLERQVPALARLEPSFVTLLVGVNDVVRGRSPEAYEADVTTILDQLLERLPADRILTVATPDYTVTPQGAAFGPPAENAAAIKAANRIMAALAEARGIAFVDIHDISLEAAGDPALVAGDGLHPSARQYARWVERIAPLVRRLIEG